MEKKKSFKTILILVGLIVILSAPNSFADRILPVPEKIQEHSNWCWDASSQAILAYYHYYPSQCDMANWAFGRADCCGNNVFGWAHACNSGDWLCEYNGPQPVRDVLPHFGGPDTAIWTCSGINCTGGALSQADVLIDVNGRYPFMMRFDWTGGGAHALVGRGMMGNNLYYMDPWPGNGQTVSLYSWVVQASGHCWTQTIRMMFAPALRRDDVIGTWSDGIWYRNSGTGGWTKTYAYTPEGTRPIAAGDVTGDGRADIVACWDSGLWYQNGATLGWTKVYAFAPGKLAVGDVTGDGRADIIGTWSDGIWYRNSATGGWTKTYAYTPEGTRPIAAGDVTGDGKADIVACWNSGLWYQNGNTLSWTQVLGYAPGKVAVGDVTGDGLADIIGTWSDGIWYRNSGTGGWTKTYAYTPEGTRPIAAGDVTGDGRADIVACWNSGLWYQNGATLGWTQLYAYAPGKLAVGDVTGD